MQDLWNQAAQYARGRGYPHEDAEDFAQDASLKLSQGRKATFRQLFIDFLRERYGDSRAACTSKRNQLQAHYSELDDHQTDEGQAEETLLGGLRYNDAIGTLDTENRIMLVLMMEWGLTAKEIGHCFGLSEARICQRLQHVYKKLKFRIS